MHKTYQCFIPRTSVQTEMKRFRNLTITVQHSRVLRPTCPKAELHPAVCSSTCVTPFHKLVTYLLSTVMHTDATARLNTTSRSAPSWHTEPPHYARSAWGLAEGYRRGSAGDHQPAHCSSCVSELVQTLSLTLITLVSIVTTFSI